MKSVLDLLTKEADYHKVNQLGKEVFAEGQFHKLEEFIHEILPLVNMAYYQHVRRLDDRRHSYEDLIQDSILALYKDISLRWDKLVRIDDFFSYFKHVCKNVMLSVVQSYHNYYSHDELDPESFAHRPQKNLYDQVEVEMTTRKIQEDTISLMRRLAVCRVKYSKAFDYIITCRYVKKESDETIKNSLRVLGLNRETINFLFEHLIYLNRLSYNYQKGVLKGNMEDQIKYEDIFKRFEDDTYKILANNYFETILPELYAEFGDEATKKFLKLFGGRQINVPSYDEVFNDLLGGLVLKLTGGNRDKLYEISQMYGLKYNKLVKALNRVEKFK